MAERFVAVVRGSVQGVAFRASARVEAVRLGVSGCARNRPDGTVLVVAEGEPDALRAFLAWLRHGPARALVDRVDVAWREPVGEPSGFTIEG